MNADVNVSEKWRAEWLPLGLGSLRLKGTLAPAPSSSFLAALALLTTAVRLPPAPGVGNLCAVGEGTPAVADAAIALEWHIVAILVAFGTERARVNGRVSADLLLALGQH